MLSRLGSEEAAAVAAMNHAVASTRVYEMLQPFCQFWCHNLPQLLMQYKILRESGLLGCTVLCRSSFTILENVTWSKGSRGEKTKIWKRCFSFCSATPWKHPPPKKPDVGPGGVAIFTKSVIYLNRCLGYCEPFRWKEDANRRRQCSVGASSVSTTWRVSSLHWKEGSRTSTVLDRRNSKI